MERYHLPARVKDGYVCGRGYFDVWIDSRRLMHSDQAREKVPFNIVRDTMRFLLWYLTYACHRLAYTLLCYNYLFAPSLSG